MKTISKIKIAFLFLVAGLAFSCKKNESTPVDSTYDSIQNTIDTVGPEVDTIMDDTTAIIAPDTTMVKKDAMEKK
ncbi:DUF948 domain-containing protein [Flavobacterium sp. 17A]|uniref:DUF948 domain-containing protein n=1 Tax=Flavobacterium potami TaxID=2872310 RepID=A0A9X1KMU4_9FLAO|nr:DUF948 domain-containing protein [Flavobacterium potami]MBZ4033400.1 DUF948 domain-containing protein [Flavobacterium potami]